MPFTSDTVQEAFGYLFADEVAALKTLAQGLPDNPTIVNIGAGAGTSGLAFVESRPDVTLITVDIQDESSPFGCLQGERLVFESAGYSHLAGVRWHQIHGHSAEVGRGWANAPVDMVFVDADHSYEGCRADIEAWIPNLKAGGILAVHDYRKDEAFAQPDDGRKRPHPMAWPGVDRAVDELLVGVYPLVMQVDSLIAFRVG
jgi:predicted O-methyltransferase YrrM